MATKNSSGMSTLNELETTLETYLVDKAPFQLPKDVKEIIVKIAPILVIIFVVLSIPAIIALFGLSAMLSPMMMGVTYTMGPIWWVSTALIAVSVVLEALSIPGLMARTMQGWKYVFYSQLVSLVATLVTGNILGAIISGLIGLYILFQVKEMYK